jgi:signal transduction histidine kinase
MTESTGAPNPTAQESALFFEVHPSVLFKLGEDLITDDAQALVELVKNAYDADARAVEIEVTTDKWFDPYSGEELETPTPDEDREAQVVADLRAPVQGRLRVIDDGFGMSTTAIRDGWLTVSASEKRRMKALHSTTRRKRTPLGDKGLGRLGAQRLGRLLFLSSVPTEISADDADQAKLAPHEAFFGLVRNTALIDWEAFHDAEKLSGVPIRVSSVPIAREVGGSIVEIRGLRDVAFWSNGADKLLERELMTILSPYDQANGLSVRLRINGTLQDLRRNARELLGSAPIHYSFNYSDEELKIRGSLSSQILVARTATDVKPYQVLIAKDNGYAFGQWLLTSKATKARELGLEAGDDKFFLRLTATRRLDTVATDFGVVDPGPFHGEASSIDFDDKTTTLGSVAALRAFAKDMSGVRVYRDGFGIRLDRDWLGLGDQQTSGRSWYGLRVANTTGYVNLSAEDNPLLEETTSREAFRDTPAWHGFYSLMRSWSKYAGDAQQFIRRGYNEYRDQQSAELAKIDAASSPSQIAENVSGRLQAAAAIVTTSSEALSALDQIEVSVESLRESRRESDSAVWSDPTISAAIEQAANSIEAARSRAAEILQQFDGLVAEYVSMQSAIELLESQVELVEEQIGRAWESVALGLSAEALTHEVDHISEGLLGRSAQIVQYLSSVEGPDDRVLSFVNFVRSNAGQLAVQSARMNPSLRYRRERKKNFSVADLVRSTVSYYASKWEARPIEIRVELIRDFEIHINEGKFSQVLDNLILNSEYWIMRQIGLKKAKTGTISITVDAPYVLVSDSGSGIDPSVASSLFDAFVTTKPGDEGRGLGLYIVRQLLESEGGDIGLTADLNSGGNAYVFRLELQSLMQQ